MSLETELAANTAALIALTEVLKSAASGAAVEKKTRAKKTEDAPAAAEGAANPAAEATPPVESKSKVVTPTVVIPTQQDVRAAATALLDADMKANGGSDANAKKTFEAIKAEYKVAKVSDVPEANRAAAIATLHAALVNLAKSSGADAI